MSVRSNNLIGADRTDPKDFGTGAIFRRVKARAVLSDDKEDTYITINMDGPNIATWVQGVQVVDWKDERPANENPRLGYREAAGNIAASKRMILNVRCYLRV